MTRQGLYWANSVLPNLKGHKYTIEDMLEAWSRAEDVFIEESKNSADNGGFSYKYDKKTWFLFKYIKSNKELLVTTISRIESLDTLPNMGEKHQNPGVCWTTHAMQRMTEYKFKPKTVINSWDRAYEVELGYKIKMEKFRKYGMSSLDDIYRYDEKSQILFTCRKYRDYILVITLSQGVKNRKYTRI